jgi:hypothetical protein
MIKLQAQQSNSLQENIATQMLDIYHNMVFKLQCKLLQDLSVIQYAINNSKANQFKSIQQFLCYLCIYVIVYMQLFLPHQKHNHQFFLFNMATTICI